MPDIGAFERTRPSRRPRPRRRRSTRRTSANPYQFTVTYSADSPFLIRANTIGTGDVTVTGPGGTFTVTPTVVPPAPTADASPLAVTYQFTAAGRIVGLSG